MRIMLFLVILLMPAASAAAQHQPGRLHAYPTYERLSRHVAYTEARAATQEAAGERGGIATHLAAAGMSVDDGIATHPVAAGLEGERRDASVTGGVIGAVIGAAVGTALACFANRDSYGVYCAGQSDTKLVIGAVIGGGIGGYIGAVVIGRRR